MSENEYTKDELNRFRELVEMNESTNQLARINGRLLMPKFIAEVGREKCDAMFQVLCNELDK